MKILMAVFLVGCIDTQSVSKENIAANDAVDSLNITDQSTISVAKTNGCPVLNYGVRRCSDLAPECSGPVNPPTESGLHCLPEYTNNLSVPCFCVGASTVDSWCLR